LLFLDGFGLDAGVVGGFALDDDEFFAAREEFCVEGVVWSLSLLLVLARFV
jgi:hypothetical protein